MKYIKLTGILFLCTLFLATINIYAANDYGAKGYASYSLKNMSASTTIDTQEKFNYGYQSAINFGTIDSWSGDDRAVQGKITNSSWINLPKDQYKHWTEEKTFFAAETYTHYIKLTKPTMSGASYNGFWYWDIEV